MPKVSVIIPTHNCAKYIPAAVESVLGQTFADYELIIVDDGSTDETRQVLQPYQGKLTYLYQENRERSAARNNGIRSSSGKYIAFLDADDIWRSEKLERQVTILDQYPIVALAYCQASYMDAQGNTIQFCDKWLEGDSGTETIIVDRRRDLGLTNIVSGGGSASMVRRDLLDKVGLFDETLNRGEDWELWERLSHQGPFAYIPEPLVRYRVYGWHKFLALESSAPWIAQHLRIIERIYNAWDGDVEEGKRLRTQVLATVYMNAALASFQLGQGQQGQLQLEKAVSARPELATRNHIMNLAVDRAKLIETETGSYREAESFVDIFFSNLPTCLKQFRGAAREASGWLYIGGASEKRQAGDSAAMRRLLAQGIAHAPVCLKNRGVVSMAIEAWLGKGAARMLRQAARKTVSSAARSANV